MFAQYAQKGSVSENTKNARGVIFSSYYELYIYAFFIGLYHYQTETDQSEEKMTDFGHPIEFWGKKGGKVARTDYSEIGHYIFAGSVIHSNVNFIELDKGLLSIDDAATSILRATEKITHKGLHLLRLKLIDKESFGAQPTDFVKLCFTQQEKQSSN